MDEQPNAQNLTLEQQAFLQQQMKERAATVLQWLEARFDNSPNIPNVETFDVTVIFHYDDGHNIFADLKGTCGK